MVLSCREWQGPMNRMENGHSCGRNGQRLLRQSGGRVEDGGKKAGRLKVAGEATEVLTARDGFTGSLGHREARRGPRQGGSWRQWTTDMAGRQAGRGGLGGVCGRKERIVVRKKKKEKWERAGICMAEKGGGPDPVFFSLSYKTHVKFFISSLFPSVSFTLPLPSLPLSLPFAAAPLSHLFTCLNSLLPGHIDVRFHFWQESRKRHRM